MAPPPPPVNPNPPQASQPGADAEASNLGSGSDRPVDHSEARKGKSEEARTARKSRPGKKAVMRSPGKNLQEGQVRAVTGYKTKPKGKPRASSSGGKPASKARGASKGAARPDRPEESPKYSPTDPMYDPDYTDFSSEEEGQRHNTTPTSSTLLRGGSPAPYAALAQYAGYEGDVSATEPQPSTSRGQGAVQGASARGQGEASLNTPPPPSPPGPYRRSANGPNITRLPPEMRRHHHQAPPGRSFAPARPRGPPVASYTFEDAFGEFEGGQPRPSSTPLHQQEEDEVLADAFNLSGDLTQEAEPGHGQPPLDVSAIGGTPTRDENTPPTPPAGTPTNDVLTRGEALMGEIRRAERILGIEGTPIESLQRHPELPGVLASEIMRQRAAQDPLGEAVASIGTPVRGVTNVQINIHAPQQVVNISPGRQGDLSPGHRDPSSPSYMMVYPDDTYKMAQPEPGLPPAGATRIGTGHQGSAIYLPPGVVAVPGAMFQEVGPGGHILQHTIPNPTPQAPPPQLQIQHQDHQDQDHQDQEVEEMEVDNPCQENDPPRHGGSFISTLAHQALEGPPREGGQAENGVFTIVPRNTPDMITSTGCFGHNRERSPSQALSGASTVMAEAGTPGAKAADAQDAGQASGTGAIPKKAPGGAPPPAKAADAQEVGQAGSGRGPSRSASKTRAPNTSTSNQTKKKPEEPAPPRDLPARHSRQRRSTSGGGSQTGRTPSASSSRQDATSESGRRRKTGAERKAAKRTNTSRTLIALALLFGLDEGQRPTTSNQWNSFCRIAGLNPSDADPMEVVRALFQPDYSFARAFQIHSDTNWPEGDRGGRERANSLSLLRLLGAYWSMTKREQVRRGFCSPGSGHERTARGRIFYTALRERRIMSAEDIDARLEELRAPHPAKAKAGGKQQPSKSSGAARTTAAPPPPQRSIPPPSRYPGSPERAPNRQATPHHQRTSGTASAPGQPPSPQLQGQPRGSRGRGGGQPSTDCHPDVPLRRQHRPAGQVVKY